MPKSSVDQALFGYDGGHRLLAGSLKLDSESARLLRAATDMSFGGRAKSYFSLLPVPDLNMQAFVRTWPAPDWLRSGAVWSHVILVDFATLGRLVHVSAISDLFRRPKAEGPKELEKELSKYAHSIPLSDVAPKAAPDLDAKLLRSIVGPLYSQTDRLSLATGQVDGVQELLSVYEQQWPRLRRDFSARTRYRTSESQWRVDLELVERSTKTDVLGPDEPWVSFLVRDLQQPQREFRAFLARYGAESSNGRRDMPLLASVFTAIQSRSSPEDVISTIVGSYRDSRSMRVLKRDLLGADVSAGPLGWPKTEPERLRLAFFAGSSVDFSDLAVGERLVRAVSNSHGKLFADLPIENLAPSQFETLIGDITTSASTQLAAQLAVSNPDLGLLIASRKPEILELPRVWGALDAELVSTVFEKLMATEQDRILEALVRESAIEALTVICERNRSIWWRLLLRLADNASSAVDLVAGAATMRGVLDRFGAAALDVPERAPRSSRQALMVLLGADLSAGLWRRVASTTWVGIVSKESADVILGDLPAFALDRAYAVALLSSTVDSVPETRRVGWQATFGYLHSRLSDRAFDGEAWRILANALPAGPEWDRCLRLRRGVMNEMRREPWPADKVSRIVEAAGDQGREIRNQLEQDQARKNKKGVVETIIGFFFN